MLDVTCTSTRSQTGQASATTSLEVSLRDECYGTVIQPPSAASDMIYLYEEFAMSFTPSLQSLPNCNHISYTLTLIDSNAEEPTSFGFNANGEISALPSSLTNVGQYLFQLEACVTVGSQKICQSPNSLPASQFSITVRNPCLDDEIISSAWNYPMEAMQLGEDSVNLFTAIG